jgi:hypothetical protein
MPGLPPGLPPDEADEAEQPIFFVAIDDLPRRRPRPPLIAGIHHEQADSVISPAGCEYQNSRKAYPNSIQKFANLPEPRPKA